MPIDLNAILTPFMPLFHRQWKTITDAMEAIGKQIAARSLKANALERATRDFPVLDFRDDAVIVTITAAQNGAMGRAPQGNFWPASIRQELLLPRLADMLRRATDSIRAAMERFKEPTAAMFNGKDTQFSDVFGHIGLLVHAFQDDYRPVDLFEATLQKASPYIKPLLQSDPSTPSKDTLGTFAVQLSAALLLIPAFFDWWTAMWKVLDLGIRLRILDEFEKIQERFYRLRREIIATFFETLRSTGQDVMELMFAIEAILLRSLVYWGRFASIYLRELGKQIGTLSTYLHKWVNLAVTIANAISSVIDMMKLLSLGPFTLGDVLDQISNGTVAGWLMDRMDDIVGFFDDDGKAHQVAVVVRALARLLTNPPVVGALPLIPHLPDIYRAAIQPYYGGFVDLLRQFRDAASPAVKEILESGASSMTAVGEEAARAARASANVASLPAWRSLGGFGADAAHELFGNQPMTAHPDPLGAAYDEAIMGAGFSTINAAVPRYIAGLMDWWREHRRTNPETPTSPHILARHARLLRVHIPRMRMRVQSIDWSDDSARAELLLTLRDRMRINIQQVWYAADNQVPAS